MGVNTQESPVYGYQVVDDFFNTLKPNPANVITESERSRLIALGSQGYDLEPSGLPATNQAELVGLMSKIYHVYFTDPRFYQRRLTVAETSKMDNGYTWKRLTSDQIKKIIPLIR